MPEIKYAVRCKECKKILYLEHRFVSIDDIVNLDDMSWSDLVNPNHVDNWTICDDCERKHKNKKIAKVISIAIACIATVVMLMLWLCKLGVIKS